MVLPDAYRTIRAETGELKRNVHLKPCNPKHAARPPGSLLLLTVDFAPSRQETLRPTQVVPQAELCGSSLRPRAESKSSAQKSCPGSRVLWCKQAARTTKEKQRGT